MKHIIFKSIVVALSVSLFLSCKPNLPIPAPSKGKIDPSRYVAIGNSITSGYADGALYYEGQINSYPTLIAQQLKLIGGGSFNQPLMPISSVGVGVNPAGTVTSKFVLGYSTDCLGVSSLMPVNFAPQGDITSLVTSVYASQGPFNNMGVPGAKSFNVSQVGFGNMSLGLTNPTINPYFGRMASNQTTSSILSDALALNPTFFSVFIGNNDVLAYAMSGGASDSITSLPTFNASILNIVNNLSGGGAKGVIGNIPDITSIPFFTTIPWNGLTLDSAKAAQLTVALGFLGVNYTFKAGNNPFVIYDASVNSPSHARVIHEGELILLDVPLDSVKCHGYGNLTPIPNQYVLTFNEITKIETATMAFNQTIKEVAQLKGLAFVDVQAFMNQTKTGFTYDGVNFNAAFVTGGTFSLDGIHLTPIGNALLANKFIKSINATYQSTIPQVDVTKYRGIVFP
ncbi:MAG: SGNH/GDSL hydrolase family protein [Bacteroidia bacterium]